METYELEPRYSTNEIPGKCIKCLGEQELNNCLIQLLRDQGIDEERNIGDGDEQGNADQEISQAGGSIILFFK